MALPLSVGRPSRRVRHGVDRLPHQHTGATAYNVTCWCGRGRSRRPPRGGWPLAQPCTEQLRSTGSLPASQAPTKVLGLLPDSLAPFVYQSQRRRAGWPPALPWQDGRRKKSCSAVQAGQAFWGACSRARSKAWPALPSPPSCARDILRNSSGIGHRRSRFKSALPPRPSPVPSARQVLVAPWFSLPCPVGWICKLYVQLGRIRMLASGRREADGETWALLAQISAGGVLLCALARCCSCPAIADLVPSSFCPSGGRQ